MERKLVINPCEKEETPISKSKRALIIIKAGFGKSAQQISTQMHIPLKKVKEIMMEGRKATKLAMMKKYEAATREPHTHSSTCRKKTLILSQRLYSWIKVQLNLYKTVLFSEIKIQVQELKMIFGVACKFPISNQRIRKFLFKNGLTLENGYTVVGGEEEEEILVRLGDPQILYSCNNMCYGVWLSNRGDIQVEEADSSSGICEFDYYNNLESGQDEFAESASSNNDEEHNEFENSVEIQNEISNDLEENSVNRVNNYAEQIEADDSDDEVQFIGVVIRSQQGIVNISHENIEDDSAANANIPEEPPAAVSDVPEGIGLAEEESFERHLQLQEPKVLIEVAGTSKKSIEFYQEAEASTSKRIQQVGSKLQEIQEDSSNSEDPAPYQPAVLKTCLAHLQDMKRAAQSLYDSELFQSLLAVEKLVLGRLDHNKTG